MDKYDFIGEIKFYDYRVNHFGFLIVYNPTSIFYHDSLRITKDSFVNIPSSNSDKSLIFFNIDRETKVPKDVVLIDSLIPENDFLNDREPDFTELQNVAKNILEKINFSELESVCSKLKISVKDKIQKIVNILPMLNIDQQYVRKYYNIIEKYYLIDDSLLYFFNNDKDHFRKIILSDTYNIADLNDQQRIFYIKQIDDIKIKDNLIKDWKFDDISKNFELVKYLNVNNLKSSSISDFINQLKKKFNEFNFSQQFDLADYFEDKELINKSINDWFFPNDNETIDLLNKIEEKDIDSSGLKKFTKELGSRFESFNNDLQILIINYMNDLDFFIEKISSKENDIIKNNFDFILDWMEKRSSEFIENDKIKSGLKKEILFFFNDNSISYLKEFCDRKSFFWLLNDKELMELWYFNDLNELANFSTFFFN